MVMERSITLTLKDCLEWAKTHPDSGEDVGGWLWDLNDDGVLELQYVLGDVNPTLTKWLGDNANVHWDADQWTFDPMMLNVVFAMATVLWAEYGGTGKDRWPVWAAMNCGGDDDVDYNGSHVEAWVDMIRAYCDAKGIQHT